MGLLVVSAIVSIVAVPRAGGAVVVVDEHVASISTDGGATYRALHRAAVPDAFVGAAMGADGTLYALRGDSLDVVRGGTVTNHHVSDGRQVAVSGATVAILRASSVDVSTDGGATFATRALPAPCPGCPSDLEGMTDFTVAGASPFLVDTSMNTCGSSDLLEWQRLVQVGPTPFQRTLVVPKGDYAAHWHFGAFGLLYGVTYAGRLMTVSAAGRCRSTGSGRSGRPHRSRSRTASECRSP